MLSDTMMLGGGRKAAFSIENSLLFRGGQYLTLTPAAPGDRRVGTFHAWARRSRIGAVDTLISAILGGNQRAHIYWDANDKFSVFFAIDGVNYQWISTASYRDPSAWYNVVVGWDTVARVLSAEINGQPVAWSLTATLPPNAELAFGAACPHTIGAWWDGAAHTYFLQGYQAEPLMVLGTRYTASKFGEVDTVTGSWRPKKLVGINFGSNGFHLGKPWDSGNLGKDASGRGNNWTPSGFVAADVVKDSPTNVYATLILKPGYTASLAEGNLQFVSNAASQGGHAFGTLAMSRGKWYWEVRVTGVYNGIYPGSGNVVGIVDVSTTADVSALSDMFFSPMSVWIFMGYTGRRSKYVLGSEVDYSTYGPAWNAVGDVIGVALDMDVGRIYFSKNGMWADGFGSTLGAFDAEKYAYDAIGGSVMPLVSDCSSTDSWSANVNFGQRPFAYTPPAGFKTLCTANLPAPASPAAKQPSNYYSRQLVAHNGTSSTFTLGWNPDPTNGGSHTLWRFKRINTSGADWIYVDTQRGNTKILRGNQTAAEETVDPATFLNWSSSGLCTFGSVIGADDILVEAWRVAPEAGFDIVLHNTSTASSQTVAHGCGSAPAFVVGKIRNAADSWYAYHASLGAGSYLKLNTADGATAYAAMWNNTSPTATNITLGASWSNASSQCVFYVWSEVPGFSNFDKFTGNGSTDGPIIYTGFVPGQMTLKRTDVSGYYWYEWDGARNAANPANKVLFPNATDAEAIDTFGGIDFLSGGVKVRSSYVGVNSTGTQVYAAWAAHPLGAKRITPATAR